MAQVEGNFAERDVVSLVGKDGVEFARGMVQVW